MFFSLIHFNFSYYLKVPLVEHLHLFTFVLFIKAHEKQELKKGKCFMKSVKPQFHSDKKVVMLCLEAYI